MPQMAPYNWLYLFMMFNFILSYIMANIYFLNFNKIMKKNMNFKIYKYMWKW